MMVDDTSDQEFSDYAFEYRMDGSDWVFYLRAASFEDAERRIYFIGKGAKMIGRVAGEYPVYMGWWVKLVVAVRNFFGR